MSDNEKKPQTSQMDDELSKLLDSALEDFKTQPKDDEKQSNDHTNRDDDDNDDLNEELFKHATAVFEEHLTDVNNEQFTPETVQAVQQRMFEMMNHPEFRTFTSTISETIQGLNQPTDGPISEDNLINILDQNAPLMPFMQGMMQNLLSKDVLYPSIKDISDKFPTWLEDNAKKLSQAEKDKYEKQRQLMVEVCGELEKENEADSDVVKRERFERVLELMKKMQDYGDPPAELVRASGDALSTQPECVVM